MATQPLPLSILCDVSVSVTPAGVSVPAFNQALIIGNSGRIPSYGAGSRCVLIPTSTATTSLAALGYQPSDPEYIEAQLYADSTPQAQYLWMGCQDPTAIQAITVDSAAAGTGYALNDTFLISSSNASYGYGNVTGISGGGVVTSVASIPGQQGTGYAVSDALSTTAQGTSVGTGLKVNVTDIGETPLQAVTACRVKEPSWYLVNCTTATDSDNVAIAAYAQSTQPAMQLFYSTQSASALAGSVGNVFSLIKAANYSRAHGCYSTTQGGLFPNNAYISGALMGKAMGLNTGLANSNFSLAAKTLVGCTTEPLSQAQINVFAGTPGLGFGNNGNSYNNYANSYDFYYQGVNGNGLSFTTVLGLDMLAADAQISILNALQSLPSIPQDDSGQAIVLNAVRGACSRSANRGFIAGGVWNGPAIPLLPTGGLTVGTALATGYWVGSSSFSTQSSADRALFKGMPVYVAVILAGTQQSFIIGVSVQQ
jgi:hypothetical protein